MVDIVEGEEFRKLEDKFERLCEVLGIDPDCLRARSYIDQRGSWVTKDRSDIGTVRSLVREALIGPDPNS